MSNERGSIPLWVAWSLLGLFSVFAFFLIACLQHSLYQVHEIEQAQNSPQTLISQAKAEADAAILRAQAASTRVAGWVQAAKDGCSSMGMANDKECLERLIQDNVTFSMAHEGNSGVTLIMGTNTPVVNSRQ